MASNQMIKSIMTPQTGKLSPVGGVSATSTSAGMDLVKTIRSGGRYSSPTGK